MLAVKNLLCVPLAFKASSIHLQSKRILKHTTLSCSERKLFASNLNTQLLQLKKLKLSLKI